MIKMILEKYRNYLYIEVMPEERKNAAFYQRFGFEIMENGAVLQLCNYSDRR